jgi:hypothetical protein
MSDEGRAEAPPLEGENPRGGALDEAAGPSAIDGRLPKVTMFDIFAKMFGFVAREVVGTFGPEGRAALIRAVESFGLERGRGIAERARLRGLPNTPENYLSSYDMDRSDEFECFDGPGEGGVEQIFTGCPLARRFEAEGLKEFGLIYCQTIDPALARGFNERMECVHDEHFFTHGRCRFVFRLKGEGDAAGG